MFNIQNFSNQLKASSNPLNFALGMLPDQNSRRLFSDIMNSNSDEERAQKIADLCNKNHITKEQLQQAINNSKSSF